MTPEKALTIEQIAEELQCSVTHVLNLIHGRVSDALPLPAVKTGRLYRVRRASFERWLEASERQSS